MLARRSRRCARWHPGRTRSRRRSGEHLHLAGTPAQSLEEVRTKSRQRWYLQVVNGSCHAPMLLVTGCLRLRTPCDNLLEHVELAHSSLGVSTAWDIRHGLAKLAHGSLGEGTGWGSLHESVELLHRKAGTAHGSCTGFPYTLALLEAASQGAL
jgi:hypothetical protein